MELGGADLGQQDYLKLMMTQLQNQNPLDPVKNKEFIAQMAQMSQVKSVSKMTNMMETLAPFNKLSSAASLVGKDVEYEAPDSDTTQTGSVDQVTRKDGETVLKIGSDEIAADKIINVY